MESLQCKLKISILWISFAVCASAAMIIWFLEPGILEQIIKTGELVNEKLTQGIIVSFVFWWLIPLMMAFLTQVLNNPLNRWLNITLGFICALIIVFYFTGNLVAGWFRPANFLVLLFMFVVTVLIAWHAWKLPKE